MSLELPQPTDLEIATSITAAIADLNKYLGMAMDSGLRVQIDYVTASEIGSAFDHRIYSAEILKPVRPS